jgi:hypothetical protein
LYEILVCAIQKGFASENTFIFDTSNLILPDDEKALG